MIVIDVRKLKDTVYDVASALVDVGSPSMHATSRDR